MKKFCLYALALIVLTAGMGHADQLDLSGWTASTYDLQGGQPPANWVLSSDNKTVIQTINADPSMYLNNRNQTSYKMEGTFQVTTSSDDDFIGFVFGYQSDTRFYVFDWKQFKQFVGGYGNAEEGFSIKKIAAANKSDFILKDFWESTDTDHTTILATSYGSGKGWKNHTLYKFILDFTSSGFNVTIQDETGTSTLWDVFVPDTTYTHGQFGFYNFSQASVEYSGFVQTGGEIVDSDCTISIDPDLSFTIPDAVYTTPMGNFGLWMKFKYYGVSPDGKLLWEMEDLGAK